MLTHQLALALHRASSVLQHKSLVHYPLEVLKIPGLQRIGQSIIQAVQKIVLLLLIKVHFIWSVARQLSEFGDILVHGHGPLFQILELLLLQLDNASGDMMCMESSSKFCPVDALGFLMGFHVHIPHVSCRTKNSAQWMRRI
jgi:hypothetical protein